MNRTTYSCSSEGEPPVQVEVEEANGEPLFRDPDGTHTVQLHPSRRSIRSATIDNRQVEFGIVQRDGTYHILIDGIHHAVRVIDARFEKLLEVGGASPGGGGRGHQVKAPIPGLVVRLLVEPGDEVSRDQPLLILDAMKLENEILSPGDGVVEAIKVTEGQAVEKDEVLIEVT